MNKNLSIFLLTKYSLVLFLFSCNRQEKIISEIQQESKKQGDFIKNEINNFEQKISSIDAKIKNYRKKYKRDDRRSIKYREKERKELQKLCKEYMDEYKNIKDQSEEKLMEFYSKDKKKYKNHKTTIILELNKEIYLPMYRKILIPLLKLKEKNEMIFGHFSRTDKEFIDFYEKRSDEQILKNLTKELFYKSLKDF